MTRKRANRRLYVGVVQRGTGDSFSSRRELFRSADTPTERTTPRYAYVIGPFRTVAGARFCAENGERNPHVTCVADAERLAKLHVRCIVWQRRGNGGGR